MVKDGVLRRLVTTAQGYSSGMVLTSSVFGFFGGTFLLVPVADAADRRADGPPGVRRRP